MHTHDFPTQEEDLFLEVSAHFIPQLDFFPYLLFNYSKSYPWKIPVQVPLPALKSYVFYCLSVESLAPALWVGTDLTIQYS